MFVGSGSDIATGILSRDLHCYGSSKNNIQIMHSDNKIKFANKFQGPVRYSLKVSIFKEENKKVQILQRKETSYVSNYLQGKFKACCF